MEFKFSEVTKLQSKHILSESCLPVKKTVSGISLDFTDDQDLSRFNVVKILKVADDVTFCKPGDIVFLSHNFGTGFSEGYKPSPLEVDKEDTFKFYVMFRENEVMGLLPETTSQLLVS